MRDDGEDSYEEYLRKHSPYYQAPKQTWGDVFPEDSYKQEPVRVVPLDKATKLLIAAFIAVPSAAIITRVVQSTREQLITGAYILGAAIVATMCIALGIWVVKTAVKILKGAKHRGDT